MTTGPRYRMGMAFGKRRAAEPRVGVVDWRGVREFEITTALSRREKRRRKVERGRLAVRVPVPGGDPTNVPLVPCAYFHPKVALSVAASRVYLDEAAEQVLFTTEKDRDAEGGETHHRVRDAAGAELGLIRRLPPPTRLQQHGWRIEQPGRPTLVAHRVRIRKRQGFVMDALGNAIGASSGEGGDFGRVVRTLEWRADDERVMTSRAFDAVVIEADWFDRRLAIAFAMLLDR
jgi:hypothetical protein